MVTAGRFAARAVLAGGLALALVSAGLLVPVTADAAPFIESARLVSLSETDPATAGDANSIDPSISGDGRYVVFASAAGNIGRLGTTAHHTQVYLRDTLLGTTTVVSSASGAAGDGDSDRAAVSGDGSSVAFISTATNLVSSARGGNAQVLLWSRVTGQLSHVSVSNDPVPNAANGRAIGLAISDDGGKVVFSSNATNLVGTPTGGVFQTYSRNLSAGATALESIDPRTGAAASNDATVPAISGDGRIVTFASAARLTNIDTQGKFQVYARDGASATTEMVSVDSSGTVAGSADSFESSVSADGASVAFASEATNLTAITAYPSAGQIYLRDRGTSSTRLISVDGAGRAAGNGRSDMPEISADGSSVAFGSRATNLVPATGSLGSGSSSLPYVRSFADERTRLACVPVTAGPICDGDSGAPSLTAHGEKIIFSSSATNLVPGVPSRHAQVFLQALTPAVGAERIGGADRFAVSASTATGAFVTGVPVAYIASGVGFADALSGSAAAGAGRGPVLLVTKDSIPTLVGIELQRLKPKRIIVLGGTAVIDPTVERALVAYSPSVSRIAGADRFETSSALSAAVFGHAGSAGGEHPRVYVASGQTFPDALSGSAAAGLAGGPVLLVENDTVPVSVATELGRLAPSEIVVLGGRNAISDAVARQLTKLAPTVRVDGTDRFAVSAAISTRSFPSGARTVYVASGAAFPDALSGSAAAVQEGSPVLLVLPDRIPTAVAAELDRLNPRRIVLLGGPAAVDERVFSGLQVYLTP